MWAASLVEHNVTIALTINQISHQLARQLS
jgi:hypothetical protein